MDWNCHADIWIHWEGRGGGKSLSLVAGAFHHFLLFYEVVDCCCSSLFHTSPRRCVVVLLQMLQLNVLFFVEKASSGDHPVSRGQGEPLRGQRLMTANQGASCRALQLGRSILLSRKGLEVTSHFHHYAVTTLPSVEGRFGCEQGVTRSILSKV